MKHIVVDGVTGFLGKVFLEELLKNQNNKVFVIGRSKEDKPFREREELTDIINNERLSLLEGDVTKKNVFIDKVTLPEIHEYWHNAAYTGFKEKDRPLNEAINIQGTQNIVNLVKELNSKQKNPIKLFHISTAYVAGYAKESFEDELIPYKKENFKNSYEETKYLAEKIIREQYPSAIILRPSAIQGDSKTGRAESDKMAYGILKSIERLKIVVQAKNRKSGLFTDSNFLPPTVDYIIKGKPEVGMNFITIDDVTKMMLLAQEKGIPGKTYHLGNPKTTPVGNLFGMMQKALKINLIKVEDTEPENKGEQRIVNLGVKDYLPYFAENHPRFDLTNTEKDLLSLDKINEYSDSLQIFLYKTYIERLEKRRKYKKQQEKKKISYQEYESRLKNIIEFGSHILSYSALSPHSKSFKLDGQGFISYVVSDKSAIMIGDPISQNNELLIKQFFRYCQRNSYEPCAVQITKKSAKIFNDLGFEVNKLGIETNILLKDYDENKEGNGSLRRIIRKAENMGIIVEEKSIEEINKEEVKHISDSWLKTKINKEELGVLLRRLEYKDEPYTRKFFAKKNNQLLGYIFFDPIFKDGNIIGLYSNIERYNGSFPNLKTFILTQAINSFKKESSNLKYISQGLSPFHKIGWNRFNENPTLKEYFQETYEESKHYAFKGISYHKERYFKSDKKQIPVYIAFEKGTSSDGVFDLFDKIGLF